MTASTERSRRLVLSGLAGAALLTAWLSRRPTPAGREVRRAGHRLGSRYRWLRGRTRHWSYVLSGRHPDPGVTDQVLAERVRAELGLVTARLDLPRVHVTSQEHVVTLSGAVGDADDALLLQEAAGTVSGVAQVVAHLEVGLPPGVHRPSEGAGDAPSPALRQLEKAVVDGGCPPAHAQYAVQRALTAFLSVLPPTERRRVISHLPYDVRRLSVPVPHYAPGPEGEALKAFLQRAVHPDQIPADRAEAAVQGVLAVVRDLDPHEGERVTGLLPAPLRGLWLAPVPSRG
jgi:uncharacterized protein (DUF2267 family)